jgi:hypothetical protein
MSAQIPRRIGTIAFASALVALGLVITVPASTAFAVDCLATPNSSTPPNSHWYYRTDRTQQRKCWYLRANNESSEQGAIQVAREAPLGNASQSVSQASKYSLASFKEFMAQHGGAKLSDQDVEKLYAEFLEWSRRANN